MYNVNFVSDDIVSAMGYAVPFKEMAGKTITAVGACIMDVDNHEITFIKGDDGLLPPNLRNLTSALVPRGTCTEVAPFWGHGRQLVK